MADSAALHFNLRPVITNMVWYKNHRVPIYKFLLINL